MTQTEFIIVGQGISGTLLSWHLEKAGRTFIVIDDNDPQSASRVAAGVINPVTGRRIVKTWMIETLMEYAQRAYTEIGERLGTSAIERKNIIDFFPSAQMLNAFLERHAEDKLYLSMPVDHSNYHSFFNYDFGYGRIDPCFVVQLQTLLPAWRSHLLKKNILLEERFDEDNLFIRSDHVEYKTITADKIIFCSGTGASQSRWFQNLPFALNKGEALIVRIPELPTDSIYKKGMTLVPLEDDLFWTGSSYEWEFATVGPTKEFLERTKKHLELWVKLPFSIEAHIAAVRPATIERRPFIGMHPHHPSIGIFNGMGTKGCSLAPYFAEQFVAHLTKNTSLLPDVNVNRFTRILQSSRQ
jgi:glycine/D-amino acid oxidase-like deaminating enzyme